MQKLLYQEIIKSLSKPPAPFKVILFGSYAYGRPSVDSDVDLLIVLDKKGKSSSYKALIQNKRMISKRLRELKKKYPIDLLVYTRDEWEELKVSGSSFFNKIEQEGVSIL
jgi:predicted nucleotidyltransferase